MWATPSLISKANAVNSIEPVLGWFHRWGVLAARAGPGFLSCPGIVQAAKIRTGGSSPSNSYTTLSYLREARPELCFRLSRNGTERLHGVYRGAPAPIAGSFLQPRTMALRRQN